MPGRGLRLDASNANPCRLAPSRHLHSATRQPLPQTHYHHHPPHTLPATQLVLLDGVMWKERGGDCRALGADDLRACMKLNNHKVRGGRGGAGAVRCGAGTSGARGGGRGVAGRDAAG